MNMIRRTPAVITILFIALTLSLAACGQGKPDGKPPVPGPPPAPGPPPLVSVEVTPDAASVAAGTTQQFIATGVRVNGKTTDLTGLVTWSTDTGEPGVATVDGEGFAKGMTPGTAIISATYSFEGTDFALTGEAALTVTPAVLVAIQVKPAGDAAALGLAAQVEPANASIPLGLTQQFAAMGVFSDGTTQDITGSVNWESTNSGVATIDGSGLATSHAIGTTTISATDPNTGISSVTSGGDATLTVTPAVLVAIQVSPADASVFLGLGQQFAATGTYTDLSTRDLTASVVWESLDTGVATIDEAGLATSVAEGATTITARDPDTGITSSLSGGDAILTVAPVVLVALQVEPANASIPLGLAQQFTVTGTYTDMSTRDMTASVVWESLDTGVAVTDAAGLATSAGIGATTITVTDPATGIASTMSGGDAILTVTPAALTTVSVEPADATVQVTQSQQFTAIGTYTDMSTRVLANAVWSSSDAGVATVGVTGLAVGTGEGTAYISAADPATGISSSESAQSAALAVVPPAPELSMSVDRVDTNGVYTTIFYTVKNRGALEAPAGFFVNLWADLGAPPSIGDAGDASVESPAVPAGQEYSSSVSFLAAVDYGMAYGVVDSGGAVAEPDETDNVSEGHPWDTAVSCADVAEPLGGTCTDTPHGFELTEAGGNMTYGGFTFDDDQSDTGTMNICSLALYGDGGTVLRHAGSTAQESLGVFDVHWAGVVSACSRGYASSLISVGQAINWTSYPTGETCADKDTDAGLTYLLCEYGIVYASTDVPMAVNLSNPSMTSTLAVDGASIIDDIQVHVDITHSWDSDLNIFLESPSGTRVELSTGNGNSKRNYTNTTFNDRATKSITSGTPPFTGTFRPEKPLSALIGENPSGTWKLIVVDTFPWSDNGTLNAWSLEILGAP